MGYNTLQGSKNWPVLEYRKVIGRPDSKLIHYFGGFEMNLRKQAKETLEHVTDASKKTIETTEFATAALIAVSAVSLLALVIAVVALKKGN
jgi:hypothetical protein